MLYFEKKEKVISYTKIKNKEVVHGNAMQIHALNKF